MTKTSNISQRVFRIMLGCHKPAGHQTPNETVPTVPCLKDTTGYFLLKSGNPTAVWGTKTGNREAQEQTCLIRTSCFTSPSSCWSKGRLDTLSDFFPPSLQSHAKAPVLLKQSQLHSFPAWRRKSPNVWPIKQGCNSLRTTLLFNSADI